MARRQAQRYHVPIIETFAAYGPWTILVLIAAGVSIGLVGGLLGIGGGVIAVPVLLEVFSGIGSTDSERMELAIGTAQAAILLSSLSAAWAHTSAGSIDRQVVRAWLPAILVGALFGLLLAPYAPPSVSIATFSGIILLLGTKMFAGDRIVAALAPPRPPAGWLPPAGIGLLSAALGVGAGTLSAPVLDLFSVPLKRSIGAGAVFNLVVAVPAVFGFVILGSGRTSLGSDAMGYVSLSATAPLSIPAMIAAPAAARLAGRLSLPLLRGLFACCLFAIATRLLLHAFG